jgi:hypothetical protein
MVTSYWNYKTVYFSNMKYFFDYFLIFNLFFVILSRRSCQITMKYNALKCVMCVVWAIYHIRSIQIIMSEFILFTNRIGCLNIFHPCKCKESWKYLYFLQLTQHFFASTKYYLNSMLNKSNDTMKIKEQKRRYPRYYKMHERVDWPSLGIEYTHGPVGIELSDLLNVTPLS